MKEEKISIIEILEKDLSFNLVEVVFKAYVSSEIKKAKKEERERCAAIATNFEASDLSDDFHAGVQFACNLIASIIMEE